MPDGILNREQNIRKRVLWPLGTTLAIFLILFLVIFQVYLQRELSRQLDNHVDSVLKLYSGTLDERSGDMKSFISIIESNADLQREMIRRDRERLLKAAEPLYRDLERYQDFTHFYFHDVDGTNLLRVHKPERYGDFIDRLTMRQARSAIEMSTGAELGPLGTFTLRTVAPWFDEGTLIGFIELGEEVEPLLEMVASQSGSQMAILIDKDYLDRERWLEGQEMLGRKSSWEMLPDHVVTATTDSRLLAELPDIIAEAGFSEEALIETKVSRKRYQGRFLSLIDASDQQVGVMLILQDVEETIQNHSTSTALVMFFCVVFGGALFASAYTILGRTELALQSARQKLVDEIEKTHQANTQLGLEIGEKRAAEKALKEAHDKLEQRVIERTAQLDQQKQLLENLISNIPSHVAWKNVDRTYLGGNIGYANLAGCTEEEIIGKADDALDWSDSFREILAEVDSEVLGENRPVIAREISSEETRSGKHYLCSAVPLRSGQGDVLGLVIILQDITEQKEKQRLLEATLTESRQANDRMNGVMRSVDDALLVIDADDNILLMNDSAGSLLRLNPEEVVGKSASTAIWLETLRDKVMEILRKREGGAVFDFEIGQRDKAADLIMQARTSALIDPNGRYEGMIFLARDVTRDRSMDRLKSDFISVAAHELRTPLATILGFSELLIDGNVENETDRMDFIRTIFEKADALSRLLDDMLDISRIESGRGLELFIEKVPVETLFMPTLNQYRKRVADRSFEIKIDDPELLVLADPEKIAQVMENLLSNAVKYSGDGSRISVNGKTTIDGYRLTVIDEGIGMTPEQINYAFDKFYRGDNADKAIKGTGLGLTIVKHIVEEHDGSVQLESRPGKGTRIHFLLPIA